MKYRRFFVRNIKRHKRDYGVPIVVGRFQSSNLNTDTGAINPTFDIVTRIRKALVFPFRIQRDFVYDLSFIAANKNFVGGGFFDVKESSIVILRKDLPTGHTLTLDDFVKIEGSLWRVQDSFEHPSGKIIGFDVKNVKGSEDEQLLAALA